MRESLFIILIVCMCIPISAGLAHAVNYDDKNMLTLNFTLSNTFAVLPRGGDYDIQNITVTIPSYPRTDARQYVKSIDTVPESVIDNNIVFYYTDPVDNMYSLNVNSIVTTRNYLEQIKFVSFPLNNLDSSLYVYTQPTAIIDVTPEIKSLSYDLIGDKTDLYEIEYVLAEYVRKNINYDLSTLTSNADQKSSWVLANKRGVCDEITNLFISLNRAAGIPARFVSGAAYTNLDDVFGKSWVSHAWAEVYFPGYGWIPYDVTYGEYGFIDAGHVKLSDNAESTSTSIDYEYYGHNIMIKPGPIDIDVNVLDYAEDAQSAYTFSARAFTMRPGLDSYDLVIVDVNNIHDYNMVADLYLANTQGISIISDTVEHVLNRSIYREQVLLKPYQSKTIYWIIKINEDDPNYIYTFPITVYNTYNETDTVYVVAEKDNPNIGIAPLRDIINAGNTEASRPYSKNIELTCSADKNSMYIEDMTRISCVLDNKGDKALTDVHICIDDNCTVHSLGIQKINFNFNKRFSSNGLHNVMVKAYNDEFLKSAYLTVNVAEKPKINIVGLQNPDTVAYDSDFEVSFTVQKDSSTIPQNVTITLAGPLSSTAWTFKELDKDKIFSIKSNGASMKPNENKYDIIVRYYDDKGQMYETTESFSINTDANFFENILLYFNVVGHWVDGMF